MIEDDQDPVAKLTDRDSAPPLVAALVGLNAADDETLRLLFDIYDWPCVTLASPDQIVVGIHDLVVLNFACMNADLDQTMSRLQVAAPVIVVGAPLFYETQNPSYPRLHWTETPVNIASIEDIIAEC